MGIPRSSYYRDSRTVVDDTALVERMHVLAEEWPRYGYRRMAAQLCAEGLLVNRKRVARLMRLHGLCVRPRRRYVVTTDSDHDGPIFPNLAKTMAPDGPDQLWVADITYIGLTSGRFVYLAIILDAWSRRVVGYALARVIDARLTMAALQTAIVTRRPPAGCVHHSDRGGQGGFMWLSQHRGGGWLRWLVGDVRIGLCGRSVRHLVAREWRRVRTGDASGR
jgi:putative transposase